VVAFTQLVNPTTVPDTNISPAVYTSRLSALLYFLLIIFAIYQWSAQVNDVIVDGVSYNFIIIGILYGSWFLITLFRLYLVEAIIHTTFTVFLVITYYKLEYYYPPEGIFDNLLIHKVFSIWTAYSLYGSTLGFWIAIPALDNLTLSIIALIILICIGWFVVDYYPTIISFFIIDYSPKSDFIFSAVIVWCLIGVAARQVDVLPIIVTTTTGIGLIS
ncbi:19750_t:CDS:2, partial [Dentiscutata erythropus]